MRKTIARLYNVVWTKEEEDFGVKNEARVEAPKIGFF